FTASQHCPSRHPVHLQQVHGLVVLVRLRPGYQEAIEFLLVLAAGKERSKSRLLGQGRLPDSTTPTVPFRVTPPRDGQPHVLALTGIDPLGYPQRMAVAQRLRYPPGEGIIHQRLTQQEGGDFALREVDKRPLPGLAPPP